MDPKTLSDEDLISLVARNESWALAELYDRYARLVFSLGVRVLNDRSGAEEIVQEVFAKVWLKAGDFETSRGKFSSWLIGIARHQCIDELRRRRVRPATDGTDVASLGSGAESDPMESAVMAAEQQRIRNALAQIPVEQRQAIELAFFEGLSHQQIADRLDAPLGTVKTRLRLGMQKLRDLLKE